ncbi:hypothetical protein SUDANB6_05698 [Streptomyces sp. enrichment culture]|uniref:hypothetical protein n=1 Tax=Streptomyces sp. enrichment culture TaxID=1795815 RepID=UPI003F56B246
MLVHFFSAEGRQSWGLESELLIPERMPVLSDNDFLFEDDGGPRATRAVNAWLRTLPSSGAPSPNSWRAYAFAARDWLTHLRRHRVAVFGTRQELVAALGTYADRRLSGPLDERLECSSRELQVTALSRFYDWAESEGLAAAVPFTAATGKRMVQGRLVETRHNRARLRRPKPHVKVQYLESDFADLFRYGLAGLGPDGLAEHVWLVTRQGRLARAAFEEYMMRGWVKAHDLRGDDGHLLRIDRRRLRTTFIAQRGQRQWSLRATVDPNRSPQVEGDHYLSAGTREQKAVVEEIARDAQGDLLRRASAPLVVDEAASAVGLPEEARRLDLAEGALAELLSGEGDVFSGACADHFAGFHGPKGQPCPARPWVCLLCPLALFTPRHLPDLLRLKAFFARQFRQMPREQFAAVFALYACRLSADILPRFEKAALAAAQRDAGDEDAELPLRAEETTS